MTKRVLERRIVLILIPSLLLCFLVPSMIVIHRSKKALTDQIERETKQLSAALTSIKDKSPTDLVNNISNEFDTPTWVSVYDKELRRIASTTEEDIGGGDDLSIALQMGCQVEGLERKGNKRMYHIITPLFSGNDKKTIDGLLEVGTSLEGINGYIFSTYRDTLIIFILGIGILGAVFHLVFRRYVATPIQRLADWVNVPDKDVVLDDEGEIGALAHSLSMTLQETEQKRKALERSNMNLKQKIEKKERDLRKAGQDLEDAQYHLVRAGALSALGEFAAGISHEINNPIGIILGFSQFLLDDVDSGHPHYKNLKRIETESSRCKKIVGDLLNFARPSESHLTMIGLNEVIDETLLLINHQMSLDKIKIIKRYHTPLTPLLADSSQMEQVLMNIIVNAVQAMPQGGELTIATSVCALTRDECRQIAASSMDHKTDLMAQEGFAGMSRRVLSKKEVNKPGDKAIKLDISDTGCGIPRENLAKIFNPFITTKEGGTGLGLSICWKLVKKQGGIIGVESVQGKGATFTIKLPLRKKQDGQKG